MNMRKIKLKKFVDKTISEKEPAVKSGNFLPRNAVNLGFYSSQEISPKNNTAIVDLSGLIPENVNDRESFSKIMYANELGILEDENGNPYVSSNDVYLSDLFLDKNTYSIRYDIDEIQNSSFAKTYYVSRYFTLLTTTSHITSNINYFIDQRFVPNNIKVVDKNGDLYADPETGKLKYRISFESFVTDTNYLQNEIPHKIIVLLEDPYITGLKLIYDKVEVNDSGVWNNQILKYSESINPVSIFERVQEESEAIDNYNSSKKIYAIKRATKNSLIKNSKIFEEDNYIFVNRKALDDNRLFQIFNWRIVGKINSSIVFADTSKSANSDFDENLSKTIKVGVIYSSNVGKDYSKLSSFSLANLESSPFNLSKYQFTNPNTTESDKTSADYWLVDIDNITDQQIRSYDFLVCDLHWTLTESQCQKINSFVDNAGSILIDAMNAPIDSLSKLNLAFTLSDPDYSVSSSSSFSYNSDSLYLRSSLNNAYDITASEFVVDTGIMGNAKNAQGAYKKYRYFNNSDLQSILTVSSKKIFTALRRTRQTDKLISGNIILSTTGFIKYCNDIYEGSSSVPVSNNGENNISIQVSDIFSNFVEGPYKFLYNCLSVALNDKTESSRSRQDIRSSVHVFAGNWYTNWVIHEDALFEDEKNKYYKNVVVESSQKYVREIINNPKETYLDEASMLTSLINSVFYDQNESNIDLYIEFTNQNVEWTNTTAASESEKNILSSTYNLVKINNKQISCDAYTDKVSSKFTIPSSFGPHVVKDKYISSKGEDRSGIIRAVSTSAAKDHPIDLKLNHAVVSSSDYSKRVNATIETEVEVNFLQKHSYTETVTVQEEVLSQPTPTIEGGNQYYSVTNFESSQSGSLRFNANGPLKVNDVYNAYAYTYDIDAGNTYQQYKIGNKSNNSDYVKYIQLTLDAAGIETTVDGDFGKQTDANVKKFQQNKKIIVDGIVDSQTKNYLANIWKDMSDSQYKKYIGNKSYKNFKKYIEAARSVKNVVNGLNSGEGFRLINFTGISSEKKDPDHIQVWVGFRLPSDSNIHYIKEIIIGGGNFVSAKSKDSPSYNGFEVLDVNISDNYDFNIGAREFAQPYTGKNGNAVITLSNNSDNNGKYVSVLLKGSSLGGDFGPTAEGIYVATIQCYCKNKDILGSDGGQVLTPKITENFPRNITKPVTGKVKVSIEQSDISFSPQSVSVTSDLLTRYGKLNSISLYAVEGDQFSDSLIDYSNLSLDLSNSNYIPDAVRQKEVVDLTAPISSSIKILSSSVKSNTVKSDEIVYPNSVVSLSVSGNEISTSCNISSYNPQKTYVKSNNVENYWITNPEKTFIRKGKNRFNYFDGIILICDQNGNPYGVNLSQVSGSVNEDIDISYSDLFVTGNLTDQKGILYGFYDNVNKEFIGKTISYTKYQQIGPLNVYIGIYVYDYDGNINTIVDYSAARNGDIFTPINVPLKMAYPIYSVSSKPQNKIQITEIPANLQKTEPWPIYVNSGSFTKEVQISMVRPKDWLSNYKDQTLIARYDTSKINGVAWSKVFGVGYYDIVDERPIVNNSRSIKLRRNGLVTVNEKSNDLAKFAANFRQIIKIYTRQNTVSSWQEVPYSQIKDIDAGNGIVEFFSSIISSDPNLTRVDYTIKSNGIGFLQANGVEIPTNPFLNRDSVEFNKPLYIYLKPKNIYKYSNVFSSKDFSVQISEMVLVDEYYCDSVVNFTYNNNIFNSNDISDYDPFALLIGIVYSINSFADTNFNFTDLRVKGGGVTANSLTNDVIEAINGSSSYWDVYPALGEAYPKAGYVIVKIPSSVKGNFINPSEVYDIVRNNITAGVVFELQDMDGKEWSGSVTVSS